MKLVYNGTKDPRAPRSVVGEIFEDLCNTDPMFIYLDADLMSCLQTKKFAAKHPDRAINCGIAEANMIGIAAGLASVGFKPVCHSFGTFASRRCFDQVFLSAGYAGNPITVIGSDPGVSAAYNGGTHMPFEDMALYRALPGATVFDVCDSAQLKSVLKNAIDMPGVKYIRVPRKTCMKIYDDGDLTVGRGIVCRDGRDAVIIACGIMVAKALDAADKLAAEGIDAAVIDMFTVKPLDEELVVKYASSTGAVVTAENHNKIGGLYSAVCDLHAAKKPTPV